MMLTVTYLLLITLASVFTPQGICFVVMQFHLAYYITATSINSATRFLLKIGNTEQSLHNAQSAGNTITIRLTVSLITWSQL